ncbi:type 2 lanthipeptide synthetase LanM family protein, partial [Nonomuraea sp. KM90]|uniref:type 2 lanthipeptide synthetase LanM family protein n=1 Tax=Nonomuraea sp. KM90 TaxID=3457428 RepID=UPI003FCDFCEA
VLARLLAQATDQAVETVLELLERLESDRARIVARVFGGADLGRLRSVELGGLGDAHQGGRSVGLLAFESGARLVYKPRPLAAHRHANDAIRWLDGRLPGYGLRTLAVLDRGAYGWLEFARHAPCEDRDGVARFHRRQGALLALLHALDGADFHFENLIACGDQPLLVDLEAILHPAVHERARPDPALTALDESVARVGLLPSVVWSEDGGAADLGGVGGDAGAVLPYKTVRWAEAGTDEMRLTREHEVLPGSRNRPVLAGRAVGPGQFAQELREGFRTAYRAIAAGRDELDGLLDAFAGDTVRVVMRATQLYGTLLLESTHPNVMRDALDRDRVLDHLWAASTDDPALLRLVETEIADLWAGDIPLFTTRPGSRSVWGGRGVRFAEMLGQESLAHTRTKIAGMGEHDLAVQDWVVQASMATRSDRPAPEPIPDPPTTRSPTDRSLTDRSLTEADPGRALEAAYGIADSLAQLAHAAGERVSWLGIEPVAENRWAIRPLGLDLYSGTTGVALFLGELAALSGEQRYADLARRALSGAVTAADQVTSYPAGPPDGLSCGPFDGYLGLAYTLARLGPVLGEGDLVGPVEPLLAAVVPAIARDEALDVVGGAAGALAASLAILDATGLPIAARLARASADRLVETAERQDRGVAWRGGVPAVHPLTGFSHGAAGIGWALARYAIATGERRYARTADAAFQYERAQFDPRLGNWPDHRDKPDTLGGDPGHVQAWCHGAPGIGLSRADLLFRHATRPSGDPGWPGADTASLAGDLDRALASYLATAPGSTGHSLCHGELGNLDLLTTAIAAGRTELTSERDRRLAIVLDQLAAGPRCGTPVAVPIPGLMTGLAGIGHGLLRHAFPTRVPSVLLLQARPRERS